MFIFNIEMNERFYALFFHLKPKHSYKNQWSLVFLTRCSKIPLLSPERTALFSSYWNPEKGGKICSLPVNHSAAAPHLLESGLVVFVSDHQGQGKVALLPACAFTQQRVLCLTHCCLHACDERGAQGVVSGQNSQDRAPSHQCVK